MDDFLAELCHTDHVDPLPVWQNGTISPCFNHLVLSSLSHSVLAISSACYLGAHRCSNLVVFSSCGWRWRMAMALLLALLFVTDLVMAVLLNEPIMYLDILADGCGILAWFIHFGALAVLQKFDSRGTGNRGPSVLLVLAILPAPSLAITLSSYCKDSTYLDLSHPFKFVRLVLVATQLFFLLVYLLAFSVVCHGEQAQQAQPLSINDSDQAPLMPNDAHVCHDGETVGEDGCSWVSRLFYLWMNPLMRRGQQMELKRPSDVYLLPCRLRTRAICQHFNHCWQEVTKRGEEEGQMRNGLTPTGRSIQDGTWSLPDSHEGLCGSVTRPAEEAEVRLLRVLHKAFGMKFYLLGVLKLVGTMLSFAGPLLLNGLVSFMEAGQVPVSQGLWCCLGLFASTFLSAMLRNIFTFEVSKVSLSVRAAVVSAIYRKSLRVTCTELSGFSLGEVVNFMSTDTDRLANFFNSFHELWSLPFQFAITLYLLYLQVGVAFLGGLSLALLLVPLNKVIATCIMENSKQMLKHKDTRVRLMSEVLCGMRVIKFYAWESHFKQKITECRKQELRHLKTIKYLDAVCVYTWAALPVVISILTFITYVLLGHELTAAKVFTALALVGMLILPLNSFPWVLNGIIEAMVSLDRIQNFLRLRNQDLNTYYSQGAPDDPQTAVQMEQCTFSWRVRDVAPGGTLHAPGGTPQAQGGTDMSGPDGSLLLRGLNLTITKGSLVAVVGKVGCGKSSLLAAITGELIRCQGALYVQGRENGFGLTAQEPWIQHATFRDNILFGKDFNSCLYNSVIEACALTDDINMLPSRDRTEVGENGVTLSGGQKARLALARAVYMDKDIYLLDDPLASVDADVAHHLFEKCILGVLKHKTRIICTHRTEFLDKVDIVILMDDGMVVKTGTPEEIFPMVEVVPKTLKNDNNRKEKDGLESQQELLQDQGSLVDGTTGEEQKQTGVVAWRVYQSYRLAVGSCLTLLILLALLLMQASKNASDWWLSHWISHLNSSTDTTLSLLSNRVLPYPHFSVSGFMYSAALVESASHANVTSEMKFYLTVYGSIAAANSLFTAARAFLFAHGAICAASVIHSRLLDRVLKASVSFFDTTPLGRILNRFSSDLYSVDDTLPFVLNILLANVFSLLGIVVVMSYGLPWILLLLLPLGALYYNIQRFYRHTSRELKRFYSLTLSPMYTHFSETLTGICTIRASGSASRFEEENESRLERNQRCLFASNAAMQWLDIRLQMIGVAVVTGISVISVIQHQTKSFDPGLVGLSLSYALLITNLLSGLIFSFTQTETQMVCVERTEEYSSDVPVEPQHCTLQVCHSWPEQGRIEFHGAVLSYRPGLPNALDGVSVVIRPGEKVGVVGRTGSGKSTLFLALFRMVELSAGHILIDDVDIVQIGLGALRSKLAIIPQDPFLFSGTVRENLDPCGSQSDPQLLDVLEQCHLRQTVHRMGGLDAEVGEKGKCLSLGQRQLLCLARALLTQAKILCIDEATASVDQKTDKLLQQTIKEKFKDKTVLTIAHRINTIMDSNKVLVMHAGKAVEFDTPAVLCQREDSVFHRLNSAHHCTMRHSRSKSLSDSLVMEDVEKGGVIVRSIRRDSFTDKGLKEGDEIIGATIHFDKLKKDDVLRVLKLIEPFDENIEILTKHHLKANASIASPKDMLKDSYSRLFHNKVQRFLNREVPLCDPAKPLDVKIGDFDGQLCAPGAGLHLEGSSLKDDIEVSSQNTTEDMVSQGCLSLTKYFLFLFNLLFFCLGLLLLSLGIWIVFDETSFFMPAPSSLSLSMLSYFLAIGGTVTMTVGFFGCLGALKEVKCMLGMYFFLLAVLLATQIVGGVLLFTQRTKFEDKVEENVLRIIALFGRNESSLHNFEKTLEYIQREIHCCGWNGPQDWTDEGTLLPCSCYQLANKTVFDQFNHGIGNGSQIACHCQSHLPPLNHTCNIYKQGCREGIKEWLEENAMTILGLLFAAVLVELCGMILSMCLYRQINLDYSVLTRYS
ncbi:hypothetical protein AAFF_G00208630 [Aldrovandia affinis]|uniref:ATP-binding cassette sub-family C member 10 n=1 Tax=Aldrovandia affinis TaxID=143900 RepID=A0AAD7W4P5_9TELE|nr:hypothetical protein AAFF_G00208630 [Aldrovandia affinis]